MASSPWKKQKKRNAPPVVERKEDTPAIDAAPADAGIPGIPPPLPPLPVEPAEPKKPSVVLFDEEKIKGGLGKAFCSTTQGLANIVNYLLRKTPYRVEFTPVAIEEGELWAEFAYPVLKAKLPDLEQNPITVLVIMTSLIMSGKVKVKKLEESHAGINVRSEDGTEARAA